MKISPVFARYPVSSLKTGNLDAMALLPTPTNTKMLDENGDSA